MGFGWVPALAVIMTEGGGVEQSDLPEIPVIVRMSTVEDML